MRGQAITTAEQQLAPTTCSTLTVVTGQAGPQEVSASQQILPQKNLFQSLLKENS